MKIFLGADHRGFRLKNAIKKQLEDLGFAVVDLGAHDDKQPCDYPQISYAVAMHVAKEKNAVGILACLTGIGHTIAANKVTGAYAALCYNRKAAVLSREHNNSNILVLSAQFIPKKEMPGIIRAWLKTRFQGGRHLRRFRQIQQIERKFLSKGGHEGARIIPAFYHP
jgi:RpiB/LacA/LacB family sugar-phosphate isomerase